MHTTVDARVRPVPRVSVPGSYRVVLLLVPVKGLHASKFLPAPRIRANEAVGPMLDCAVPVLEGFLLARVPLSDRAAAGLLLVYKVANMAQPFLK